MKKIIYHGSKEVIEKPLFNFGKRYNDFGRGFYTTDNIEIAKEWAVKDNIDGYLNYYEIDIDNLSFLDLTSSSYSILNYISLLLQNRFFTLKGDIAADAKEYLINNFSVPLKNYDVIVGYRGDNSNFSYLEDFINNSISLRKLKASLTFDREGKQIVLKSKKAFDSLSFIKAEKVYKDLYYQKKIDSDIRSREEYFSNKIKREKSDIYILNILNEKMKNNDFFL